MFGRSGSVREPRRWPRPRPAAPCSSATNCWGSAGLGRGGWSCAARAPAALRLYGPWLALYGLALAAVVATALLHELKGRNRRHLGVALCCSAPAVFILAVGFVAHFRALGRHFAPLMPVLLLLLTSGLCVLWGHRGAVGQRCGPGILRAEPWFVPGVAIRGQASAGRLPRRGRQRHGRHCATGRSSGGAPPRRGRAITRCRSPLKLAATVPRCLWETLRLKHCASGPRRKRLLPPSRTSMTAPARWRSFFASGASCPPKGSPPSWCGRVKRTNQWGRKRLSLRPLE